jgi:hypothetical protein
MPAIRKQPLALDDLKLIRFSSIVRDETQDLDTTVHSFEPDERWVVSNSVDVWFLGFGFG